MNEITIFGTAQNITPVSAASPGNTVANTVYTLAVERGGIQPSWDYFTVSAYGKQAEFAAGNIHQNETVLVSGYLQDSGIERNDTKIIVATQQSVLQKVNMPSIVNRVNIMGRLTKDPEARVTNGNKAVTNLRIAFSGRSEDATNYIDASCFDKTAEFASKYLHKGTKVIVSGSLRNNNYTNRENIPVYKDVLTASRIEFAESKSANSANVQYGAPAQAPQYGAPAQAQQYQYGYGAPAQAPQTPPAPPAPPAQAPQTPPAPPAQAPQTPPAPPAQTQQFQYGYGVPAQAPQTPPAPPAQAQQYQYGYGVPAQVPQTPPAPPAQTQQTPPAQAPQTQATQAPPAHQGEGYVPAPAAYMDNNLPFA